MIAAEKTKIDQIETFISIISYIRNQIDLYSSPIAKIFGDIGADMLDKLHLISSPKKFDDIINANELYLGEETQKTLCEFSSTLGKSYREMQIKLCDKTLSELEAQKRTLQNAFPSRKKTILALCLGIGGVAVIALI
jgi:hypothetical protein